MSDVQIKINRNAVSAITRAVVDGLTQVNATGSLLTQVCKVSAQMYRNKNIPKQDVGAVLDSLSERMSWKGGAEQVRRSEYKAVLNAYVNLPEAMNVYRERAGKCTWHDGIALARLLNSGDSPSKAASAHAKRGSKKNQTPKTVGEAKQSAAISIKRVLNSKLLPKAFRDALRELAVEHGIKV